MKINKFFSCLLVFALLCVITFNFVNVFASDSKFSIYGSSYDVTEVLDEVDLGYGVSFVRENGTTSILENGLASGIPLNEEITQQVHLLTVKPSDNVLLVPYTYIDGGSWSAMPVKKAAIQYEMSHPGYKVIAGVNGDFFKINNSIKASTGVTVSQGEYYKAISHHNNKEVNTLGIRNNGEGKQLFTTKVNDSYPVLSVYDNDGNVIKKFDINKVNEEPGNNEIALYYSIREENFGKNLIGVKVNNAWFVNDGDAGLSSCKDSFYGLGEIDEFLNKEVELANNQFAIKSNNSEVNSLLSIGVKIRAQYEYKDPSLENVENFIGFPFQLIADGKYVCQEQKSNDNWKYRHPRTMVGQKENGEIVLAVVDGRQSHKNMNGVTGVEMSAILASKGCVDAWNLDGGGSSTMIVRKMNGWDFANDGDKFNKDNSSWYITNSPSDGSERSDGNHLFVVVKLPEVKISIDSATTTSITLNVVLLSEIEKYKDLYVLVNNNYYQVVDEKVIITGLNKDTDYDIYLYSKVGGQYLSLMNNATYCTNKEKPTSLSLNVSLFNNKGVEQILFKYTVDKDEAIRKIVFIDSNGKKYMTTGSLLRIEKNLDFYEMINTGKIEIYFVDNSYFDEQVLVLDDFNIEFDLMFMMDEMLFNTNELIDQMFK